MDTKLYQKMGTLQISQLEQYSSETLKIYISIDFQVILQDNLWIVIFTKNKQTKNMLTSSFAWYSVSTDIPTH